MRSPMERGQRRRRGAGWNCCCVCAAHAGMRRSRERGPVTTARRTAEGGRRTSRLGMTSPPQTQNDGQEVRKEEERGIAPDSGNKTSFSGTRTAQCSNVNKSGNISEQKKNFNLM